VKAPDLVLDQIESLFRFHSWPPRNETDHPVLILRQIAAARSFSSTLRMRSSVERIAREINEAITVAAMKNAEILMPSGRS
jgi:hypothetical protein